MRRVITIVLAAAPSLCGPAMADWQFTKWGQSPAEVMSLSKIALKQSTAQEQADYALPAIRGVPMLNGIYTTEEFKAPVWLYFDHDKLSGVYLRIPDGETANLIGGRLSNQYGAPTDKEHRAADGCERDAKSWNDSKRGNRVRFYWQVCDTGFQNYVLLYVPLEQSGVDSGL
ncbi:hypothetical protein [Mesorhizobium neociceri]|uniref:Uncharacterized protein n=1 Tax=Mesorhizobium neociceri TaxID=1307853 RepID=A0A838B543_9HYPH|nr:hypothetical protein [Mesorhizobium neociceri]MBA1141736.1 hypothetical protein [Mesorhizobium neociceri]